MKRPSFMSGLLLSTILCGSLVAQSIPAGWKLVKDDKGRCRVAVPPDWSAPSPNAGAASAKNQADGSLVVTNDPFTLKPLPESMQKIMKVGNMFENTTKRVFYSTRSGSFTSYNVSVPGNTGTCNTKVTFSPSVPESTAKDIALSIGPVK